MKSVEEFLKEMPLQNIAENNLDLEYIKEYDRQKTKVFKYITYKKRTEQEVRTKFKSEIKPEMLDDIIEYLKEEHYLDDEEFIVKQVREYINLKTLSIKEIKFKLYSKGIDKRLIEKYVDEHKEELQEYEKKCIEKIKNRRKGQDEQKIRQYLYSKGYLIER